MSERPSAWITAPFGVLNSFVAETVNPASSPGETFELYSVPAFPSGQPEINLGASIGSTKQSVQPGDVLVCKINPRINRVWEVGERTTLRQIASSEWIGFRVPGQCARYYRYYFSSPSFRDLICADLTGVGGSLTRAQPKRVFELPVPVAPVAEQQRIADRLDVVLARVDACRDRLAGVGPLLKRFRQSVLEAATSGRLTQDWRSGNDWKDLRLGAVLDGKPRNGYSPKSVDYPTNVRSLTLSATTSGRFKGEHSKYIDEEIQADSHLWLQPGDVLIQRANSLEYVGVSALFDGEPHTFIYPDLMMKARADRAHMQPEFLHIVLSCERARKFFRDNASGTAGNMPKINQQTVISLPIRLPPLREQAIIVGRVQALFGFADRIEARLTQAQDATGRLTPALLAKAFRGELAPQDPNDEPASELLKRLSAERGETVWRGKQRRTRDGSASA